jgi:hypothetical protein
MALRQESFDFPLKRICEQGLAATTFHFPDFRFQHFKIFLRVAISARAFALQKFRNSDRWAVRIKRQGWFLSNSVKGFYTFELGKICAPFLLRDFVPFTSTEICLEKVSPTRFKPKHLDGYHADPGNKKVLTGFDLAKDIAGRSQFSYRTTVQF